MNQVKVCSCGLQHSLQIEDFPCGDVNELESILNEKALWAFSENYSLYQDDLFRGNGHLLLGFVGSEVVTYAVYDLFGSSDCTFHHIQTNKNHQRKGYGIQISCHLFGILSGNANIHAMHSSQSGKAFLQKLGFAPNKGWWIYPKEKVLPSLRGKAK